MRTKDIAPLIKAVATVVREYVGLAVGDVVARVKALEDRPLPRDGKDGAPGVVGERGADGVVGPTGAPGADGPPGAIGAQGPAGERGADGTVGPQGAQGLPGPPGLIGPAGPTGERGSTGEKGLDGLIGERGPEGPAGLARDGRDGQPGVPGTQGEKGTDGLNGRDGVDGRDGTLKDQIKMVRRSERVLELCFKDGSPIEGGLVEFHHPVFKGTFVKEADYEEGDIVQWGSSGWIAIKDKPAGTPGIGSREITGWQLFNKPGRDGKDLRPDMPAPALPVVSVGKKEPT